MKDNSLTIGELAKRGNVSTSLLRYYEKEKLLVPSARTDSGYRMYSNDSLRSLRFIRAAQRYGFSLSDIKLLVRGEAGETGVDILDIAEQRFVEIERRITEMLVLRHELELFLDDLTVQVNRSAGEKAGEHYRELVEQICGHENHRPRQSPLHQLLERLNCNLGSEDWESVFAALRGKPVHIWREDDGYFIQLAASDPAVRESLEKIAAAEVNCEAHSQPQVLPVAKGWLFTARGDNAFLYAQLFLALEADQA